MQTAFSYVTRGLAVAVFLDLFVVSLMGLAIMSGDPGVQHIPFWDAQLRFLVELLG